MTPGVTGGYAITPGHLLRSCSRGVWYCTSSTAGATGITGGGTFNLYPRDR